MQSESLEFSLLSIFSFLSFFTFFIIQKFSHKIMGGLLLDSDFDKPQAFHKSDIPRSGGLACLISFIIFVMLDNLLFSTFYIDYLVLGTGLFLIGFLDDVKFRLSPKARLVSMTAILLVSVKVFSIQIYGIDFILLNQILSIKIVYLFFIILCFLFIINGSNLIDGFNGLLGIHSFIILFILSSINLIAEINNLSLILFCMSSIILVFILFNFPNAKFFLGDSGAYLIGSLIAVSTVITSINNPTISPFFFCILLFYLFFEVFFSFFRKLLITRQSPLFPDNQHLHMRVYKFLLKKNYLKTKANYSTSIYINFAYLILIFPSIILLENFLFCKYYFVFLLIVYIYFYKKIK